MSEADPTTFAALRDVLLLSNWNTRVVILGVAALGASGGAVGSFMLLRRRALLGDALSHATLPGIVICFLVATMLGFSGKSFAILLPGALLSGVLGVFFIQFITRVGRLSEDAALGIVLSTFFGAGIALLGLAQQETTASAAGLESFIYGKTASMLAQDATLIAIVGLASIVLCLLLFKELRLICFDKAFASGQGLPTTLLDLILMSMVVAVVIVGLQAVGLILVIAILVIPAAAARFWTDSTMRMFLTALFIGGFSAWIGAAASAVMSKLPAGAMIVLVMAAFFVVSMLFGQRRGILRQALQLRRAKLTMERDHALRAVWELLEDSGRPECLATDIGTHTGWGTLRVIQRLEGEGHLKRVLGSGDERISLTPAGERLARDVVRRHRLWEHYLIRRADFDASHVDRGADELEHLLPAEILQELEAELQAENQPLPASPHLIQSPAKPRPGGSQ